MANNILGDGKIVTRTAPVGGVTSGTPVVIGSEFLIPLVDAVAGASFSAQFGGEAWLTADAGDTFTEGLKVYWDPTAEEVEDTDAATNYEIGTACGAASGGRVKVRLNGVALASLTGDLVNKIDKVTGLTGYVPKMTAAGGLESSGILATAVQVDTVPAAPNSVAGLNAAGELYDSTVLVADLLVSPIAATDVASGAAAAGVPLIADGAASCSFGAVTTAGLTNESVTAAKLAADDGAGGNATAGYVPVADGAGGADYAQVAAAGIANLAVTAAKMGSGAATVGLVPVADGAGNVAYGQVPTTGLTNESVTAAKLAGDDGIGGNATAGYVAIADGAGGVDYGQVDSAGIAAGAVDLLHTAGTVTVGTIAAGGLFTIELDAEAAATPIDYDLTAVAGLAFQFRIVFALAHCTGANGGGTLRLYDAAAGGGNAITAATTCAVAGDMSPANIDYAQGVVNGATDTISIVKNAAGDDGRFVLFCRRV